MMRIRLQALGERTDAQYGTGPCTLYRIGGDGKRSDSGLVLPSFVTLGELEQHLFDLLHESAKPGSSTIRRPTDP